LLDSHIDTNWFLKKFDNLLEIQVQEMVSLVWVTVRAAQLVEVMAQTLKSTQVIVGYVSLVE